MNILNVILISAVLFTISKISKKNIDSLFSTNRIIVINAANSQIFAGNLYDPNASESQDENNNKAAIHENAAATTSAERYIPTPIDWRAKPLNSQDQKKAKIAIVIVKLGLNQDQLARAIELPTKFTLGFSPYATGLTASIDKVSQIGFEVLLQLPMQPIDYQLNDPGPYAMLLNNSSDQNNSIIDKLINNASRFVGFYTEADEVVTGVSFVMENIFHKLNDENLFFVNANESNITALTKTAERYDIDIVHSDMYLDNTLEKFAILNKLNKLKEKALQNGKAVGYIHSYPLSIDVLYEWYKALNQEDVIVVPVSALIPHGRVAKHKERKAGLVAHQSNESKPEEAKAPEPKNGE